MSERQFEEFMQTKLGKNFKLNKYLNFEEESHKYSESISM